MEELLNQFSLEITLDWTVQLFISKIDLDYAYGQMELSEDTSRQCVFALTGQNFSGNYSFKETALRTCRYTHIPYFKRKLTEHSDTVH